MNSADLIKELKQAGWTLGRIKSSHHQMVKDGKTITVPHPRKDLPIGTVKAIRKSAGLV